MCIKIQQIDHVVLCVSDLERAIRFYQDVLGCREERRVDSINLVQMRAGHSLIDLLGPTSDNVGEKRQRIAGDGGNMDHFAVRLESFDEVMLRAHLETHGIAAGEVKHRYGAEGEGPSMYIQDPDGNTVELKGPPAAQGKGGA